MHSMAKTYNNLLRSHRRRSPATLSDLAFLFDQEDTKYLSKYERGKMRVSLDVLMLYMLVFGCHPKDVLQRQFSRLQQSLFERIPLLITDLKSRKINKYKQERINFWKQTISTLQEINYSDHRATTMSIYPCAAGFSYAIFKDEQRLFDMSLDRPISFDQKNAFKKIRELIEMYEPRVLVLRKDKVSKRINSLQRKVTRYARAKAIPIHEIGLEQVQSTFQCFGAKNQYERTQKLREWFPDFSYRDPSERNDYSSKCDHQYAYDALAQGVAFHFSQESEVVIMPQE